MIKRLKGKTAGAAMASLIAALGVGGIAVGQSLGNASPTQQAKGSAQAQQRGNAKVGSASVPSSLRAGEDSGPDRSEPQDQGDEQAGSQADNETDGGSGGRSGSKADDGRGGRADEPGSPDAGNQAQGRQS